MMNTPTRDPLEQKILDNYQADVARWKERGGHYKDIQPLAIGDVLLLRAQIHPTKRAESKEVTRSLVNYLCDQEITTAKRIYEDLGLSDKPVLKRLKLLQQHGLVRRESKRYYVATPRLQELRNRYLKRICA
jgi:hypothetical protein